LIKVEAKKLAKLFFNSIARHCFNHSRTPIDCLYAYNPARIKALSRDITEEYTKMFNEWFGEHLAFFIGDELYIASLNSAKQLKGRVKDAYLAQLKTLRDALYNALMSGMLVTSQELKVWVLGVTEVLPKKPSSFGEKVSHYLGFYDKLDEYGKKCVIKALIKELDGLREEVEYDFVNL
jgi:hypothetical protein